MRDLLDSNVLISLLDSKHAFNPRAHEWWANNTERRWASCPLTENAVVRIMSNPGYDKHTRFPILDVVEQMGALIEHTDHEFWPDDISLLDDSLFDTSRILGPRQLTDLYLLALAAHHNGRLVTFDERIPASAVRNASADNLCAI